VIRHRPKVCQTTYLNRFRNYCIATIHGSAIYSWDLTGFGFAIGALKSATIFNNSIFAMIILCAQNSTWTTENLRISAIKIEILTYFLMPLILRLL
jgi:hypothetical protein